VSWRQLAGHARISIDICIYVCSLMPHGKALLRLFEGCIKALSRLYEGFARRAALWSGGMEKAQQSVGGLHCLAHSSLLLSQQKSRCYIKFVKWLVRKNRSLSMSKNDDELNELFYSEFIDEVTDTACLVSK
jgi:hypothetical protein